MRAFVAYLSFETFSKVITYCIAIYTIGQLNSMYFLMENGFLEYIKMLLYFYQGNHSKKVQTFLWTSEEV